MTEMTQLWRHDLASYKRTLARLQLSSTRGEAAFWESIAKREACRIGERCLPADKEAHLRLMRFMLGAARTATFRALRDAEEQRA